MEKWSKIGASLFFAAVVTALNAMDWPNSEGRQIRNFGMNDDGFPCLGDDFSAKGDIRAVDSGEILFFYIEEDSGNFVSPLGNWIALNHNNDLVSVYGRLGDVFTETKDIFKDDVIAEAGQSGWSNREGYYFSFFDKRIKQWINPVVVLNSLKDTIPPVVQFVKLKSASGQIVDLSQTKAIKQRRYSIIVQASDRSEAALNAIAPFRIVSSFNGVEIGRLEMETFSARDGSLMIYRNGLLPARQIYEYSPSFEVAGDIPFIQGQAMLDVTVEDFYGNKRKTIYRLAIE
jgi:hypothetical protein